MPSTSVLAAAEGLPNYSRNPHRFGFARKLLMAWNSRAGDEPVVSSSLSEIFMNHHVSRRTLMTTGVAAAGAAFAVVGTADKAIANPPEKTFSSIDERLEHLERVAPEAARRLRVRISALLDDVEAMIEKGESDEAIAAYCENWGRVSRATAAVTG